MTVPITAGGGGRCGSMHASVCVADPGGALLPFPNGSIHVQEHKEAHAGVSGGVSRGSHRGSPGAPVSHREPYGPEQEVPAAEEPAASDNPDSQKLHILGPKPGQEPGAGAPPQGSILVSQEQRLPGSRSFSGSVQTPGVGGGPGGGRKEEGKI